MKKSLKNMLIGMLILLGASFDISAYAECNFAEFSFENGHMLSYADGGSYETVSIEKGIYNTDSSNCALVSTVSNLPYNGAANLRFDLAHGPLSEIGWSNPNRDYFETTLEFDFALSGDYDSFSLLGRALFVGKNTDGSWNYASQLKGYKDNYFVYKSGAVYVDGSKVSGATVNTSGFNTFKMVIKPDMLACDIYLNNTKIGANLKLDNTYYDTGKYKYVGFSWLSAKCTYNSTYFWVGNRNGNFAIDNVRIFSDNYSASEQSRLRFRQRFDGYAGDSIYESIEKTAADESGNTLTNTVRVESNSQYSANSYLHFNNTASTQDCMINATFTEDMPSFVIAMDVMTIDNTLTNQLFFLRDKSSSDSTIDIVPVSISAAGELKSGSTTIMTIEEDKWYTLQLAVNSDLHTYNLYVNGIHKASGSLNTNFNQLDMFRIRLDAGGTGSLLVDNLFIYEGDIPRIVSDNEAVEADSPFFRSDEYVIDKIGSLGAVNPYAKAYFKNGVKHTDERIYYAGDEAYVPEDIWQTVTGNVYSGSLLTEKSGIKYIPLYAGATEAGIEIECDNHGLFLIGDGASDISAVNMQEISNYMFFARYSKQEILSSIENISEHPRLIATSDDFDRVKNLMQTDTMVSSWVNNTISMADRLLKNTSYVSYALDNRGTMLDKSRTVLDRILCLGFANRITEDETKKKAYADRAYAELDAASKFPNWNSSAHYLDTAEMSFAFGLAYDWFYDVFTKEQKTNVVEALKTLGLDTALAIYKGSSSDPNWWVTSPLNWNGVCNGGVGAAALAIAETDVEYSTEILYNALRASEYAWYQIAPDGAWDEGLSYWEYYLRYVTYFMSSVNNSFERNLNWLDYKGADKIGLFSTILSSDAGVYNFHDCTEGFVSSSSMYYISNMTGNNVLTMLRTNDILNKGCAKNVTDILWYNPELNTGELSYANDNYIRGAEAVTMRESWTDENGMFAAYHGGVVSGAHMHYDTGSFVYDVNGIRWASDLGPDGYDIYSLYGDDNIYRKRAEGHNIFVINPSDDPGQDKNGYGTVEAFETNEFGSYSVIDLTSCYNSYVTSAKRGIKTQDNKRSIIIRDELELKSEYPIYWFVHSPVKADKIEKISNNKFIITKSGKQVVVLIDTNLDDFEAYVMKAEPLETTSTPLGKQNQNTNFSKIAIKANASGSVYVTMKLMPVGEGYDESYIENNALSDWELPVQYDPEPVIKKTETGYNITINTNENDTTEVYLFVCEDTERLSLLDFWQGNLSQLDNYDVNVATDKRIKVMLWEKQNQKPLMNIKYSE